MELLHGGDLHERTPLPWQAACAIARDVCSVLSLLHSRRLIYRDLSPRNVRLTRDGQAKVIDFGAMLPMGADAPGGGHGRVLRARGRAAAGARRPHRSVFAGRHALLRARRAARLSGARLPPAARAVATRAAQAGRASVSRCRQALDALVMELISLDPALRPASAGEVMERLTAIGEPARGRAAAGLARLPDHAEPGRAASASWSRVRKKLAALQHGRGGALLIRGAGRQRPLAFPRRHRAGGQARGRDGAARGRGRRARRATTASVRALCAQLLDAQPELAAGAAAPHLPLLGHRRAGAARSAPTDRAADLRRPQRAAPAAAGGAAPVVRRGRARTLDRAARRRLSTASTSPRRRFSRCSPTKPRAAGCSCAAACARQAPALPAALKLLHEASAKLSLGKLNGVQTEQLLRSVFGDVPHVQLLSMRLHGLAEGNPRDVLQLAQHLVEKGVLRYHAGAWSLPASIDPGELPASMAQALDTRIAALPPAARDARARHGARAGSALHARGVRAAVG